MSNNTSSNPSDWRQSICVPPGFAERLRAPLARIERAGEFIQTFDPLKLPTLSEVPTRSLEELIADALTARIPTPPTPMAAVGKETSSWQASRDRLIALRRSGASFTSLRDLAARVGCSEGLIRKAIKSDTGLRAWSAEAKRTRRTAPAATSLDHAVRRVPQRREIAPDVDAADSNTPADDDAVLQRLIEAASPSERARLHAMPPDQLRSLLRLVGEQHADHDRAPLRKRA
jgi:hypothetical protein